MEKPAETDYPIHDLLTRRWSPRAFSDQPVPSSILRRLLEAARWAPSSNNEQPWRFLLATKEDQTEFTRLLSCLIDGNVRWAQHAPVLLLSTARMTFQESGNPNRHAFHDVGLAVANLSLEATALGLFVHQMAGILPDRAKELYAIPEEYEPVTAIAVGYSGDPDHLSERLRKRELATRSRKPLAEFVFSQRWGDIADIVMGAEEAGH